MMATWNACESADAPNMAGLTSATKADIGSIFFIVPLIWCILNDVSGISSWTLSGSFPVNTGAG
jgi:hypothetical protein